MKRHGLWVAALALSGCCNDDEASGSAPAASAQAMLEECVAADAAELEDLLRRLQSAAAGDLDGLVRITGLDLLRVRAEFAVDLDGDLADDITGTLRFEDASGRPTLPFDPFSFLDDPLGAIAAVPDGTSAIAEWTFAGSGDGHGEATYRFEGGTVVGASGSGTFARESCGLEFDFTADASGAASISFEAAAGVDVIRGSVEPDGPEALLVRARLGSKAEQSFRLDLRTGLISPI